MSGYTVYISYILTPQTGVTTGFSQAIHCNYIKSLQLYTDDPTTYEINLYFSGGIDDFKFLCDDPYVWNGTGYTAYRFYALVQLVANSGFTSMADVKPDPALWKKYEIIPTGHIAGTTLSATELTSEVFKIELYYYYIDPIKFASYTLDYLNYPVISETDKLCFGSEIYFFGNVTTDIEAIAYITDISINLKLNEFNSSTNPTWDGLSSVAISEIGIYAEVNGVKELVAIGKLNDPIIKDSTISRTIEFAIDF
jgi:hypothetical protein